MARLSGAATVIVGIEPHVVFALVQLSENLEIHTALDLEEGLTHLELVTSGHRTGQSDLGAMNDRSNDDRSQRQLGNRWPDVR